MLTAARRALLLAWIGLVPVLGGCAACSPLNGIPANYYPDDLQGEPRSGRRTIDLSLLGQTPPDAYRLDSGDVLSIYIDGVLGRRDQIPPVYYPRETDDTNPSFGYPVAVRDDGTIRLPLGKPIMVRGLTIAEAEEQIRHVVQDVEQLQNAQNPLLLVSLQRKRQYKVLVLRQEQSQTVDVTGGQAGQLLVGSPKRGSGKVVTLTAYENDVAHALTETGGLPGLDAENTIYVIRRRPCGPRPAFAPQRPPTPHVEVRGQSPEEEAGLSLAEQYAQQYGHLLEAEGYSEAAPPAPVAAPVAVPQPANRIAQGYSTAQVPSPGAIRRPMPGPGPMYPFPPPDAPPVPQGTMPPAPQGMVMPPVPQGTMPAFRDGEVCDIDSFLAQRRLDSQILTIPVRLGPGQVPNFTEQDILLYDGDIVFIESRETEVFYTGGLLGGNQFALPRDYDIDVVRAIAIASGANQQVQGGGWGNRMGGVSALNRDISVGASDVIVMRQLPNGSQVPIKVDLYKALREPRKYSVRIVPGDYVILQYKPGEAVAAFIERNLLAGGIISLAAVNGSGGNN